MLDLAEYEALRSRPTGPPAMHQRWRSLLFAHFSIDPEVVQSLIPVGLTVDTFPDAEGKQMAWVGLVPFRMEGVTPRGVPEIPGIHAFPETNVRTYVHREGKEPGVWFFSLDASNSLACSVARNLFHLPYHEAKMTVLETDEGLTYRSARRKGQGSCLASCQPTGEVFSASPGTLEFFLAERYLLYAKSPKGLHTGRVYHTPYRLRNLPSAQIEENLILAAGLPSTPFENYLFSAGVDVEVFKLSPAS